MKQKKSKQLTIRQQIQQCPTLTAEERALALYGLNKAKTLNKKCTYSPGQRVCLSSKFVWASVAVIKGQHPTEACLFWRTINKKLETWQQSS